MLLLLLFVTCCSIMCKGDMTVFWTRCTDPVVMGGNLRLFCNTSLFPRNCTYSLRWRIAGSLVSIHDIVTNKSKYAVKQMDHGHTLVIKNLTIADFNIEYKCSYGFYSYKKNMTLPASFFMFPRNATMKKEITITNRTFLLDVVLKKVHPIPVCNLYFDKENLSAKVEVMRKENMYQVKMAVNHTARPDQCDGRLLVYCTVGTKNITIFNDILKFECKGTRNVAETVTFWTNTKLMIVICIIVVILVILVIIIILWYRRKKKPTEQSMVHGEHETERKETSTPLMDTKFKHGVNNSDQAGSNERDELY